MEVLITIVQRFCREVILWKSLDNPNVLPLLGAAMGGKYFRMVSKWMNNGNINEFVEAHRSVNRFELVRSSYHCQLHPLLIVFLAAQKCHQRVDVFTQTGSGTWRSERGTIFTVVTILMPNLLSSRQTS